jgi:DNA-binding protein YbaB
MFNQAKMVMQMKKAQKELANKIIEVEVGAVTVRIACDQKLKGVTIDPEQIDLDEINTLERQIEQAMKEAIDQSQKYAAEKMKPLMGSLGL